MILNVGGPRRMSLRARVTWLAASCVAGAVALVSLGAYLTVRQNLYDQVDATLGQKAGGVVNSTAVASFEGTAIPAAVLSLLDLEFALIDSDRPPDRRHHLPLAADRPRRDRGRRRAEAEQHPHGPGVRQPGAHRALRRRGRARPRPVARADQGAARRPVDRAAAHRRRGRRGRGDRRHGGRADRAETGAAADAGHRARGADRRPAAHPGRGRRRARPALAQLQPDARGRIRSHRTGSVSSSPTPATSCAHR